MKKKMFGLSQSTLHRDLILYEVHKIGSAATVELTLLE